MRGSLARSSARMRDTEDFVWLMLHSGSRNIGKELAERHISTAKSLWRLSELPAPDLAYFIQGTPEFAAYWKDLEWAQTYAMKNREIMMARLLKVFNKMFNHLLPASLVQLVQDPALPMRGHRFESGTMLQFSYPPEAQLDKKSVGLLIREVRV
jgi:hypothetical protein